MIERIVSKLISSNVFVVSNKDKCVIIDAGVELSVVKEVVGDKKVEAILLTHGHFDHCTYALDYAKEYGVKIYASEYAREYLMDADLNYSEGGFAVSDFSNFEDLSGNGTLKFKGFEIEYFQLGGHSKSDMVFKIGPDIFVGDIVIGRDMGRIDLYGASKSEMIKSLTFLKNLSYETMHSGHGNDHDKNSQDKVIDVWLRFISRY